MLAEGLDDLEAAARALAERIHVAMRPPVAMGDRHLYTSVSIGIAEVIPDTNPEVNLAQADAAMYQAKRRGPARYEYYNPVIGDDSQRQSQLAHDLRAAHQCGQLTVHYQPLFRLGGDMVGMEALLRWHHPELGAVSPLEFVPLLERSREIIPVGRWVLHEAAGQCRRWQEQGHPDLTVSVNVSACQLRGPRLPRRRPGCAVPDDTRPPVAGARGDRVRPGRGHRSGRDRHAQDQGARRPYRPR